MEQSLNIAFHVNMIISDYQYYFVCLCEVKGVCVYMC